ncbi:MAG TPA: hypothetical protein PLW44_00810 [Chitinophagales bacterium]|nr:hypothetical protein [Chitinophagales bacterium]
MYFSKLTSLLQALDKPAFKKLQAYIYSPYFRVPTAAVALFGYLQKQYPRFDEKKLHPTLIAAKVPRLPNANKQAKASTYLLKAVEHFLALEQLELKRSWRIIQLLQSQKRLGLNAAFESTLVKTVAEINRHDEKDIDYFFDMHQLAEIKHNGFYAKLQRNTGNNLLPVTETFDTYYAVKTLRYHCELYSRHQVLGTGYEAGNITALLQVLRPYINPQYPYVYLFANVYQMMVAPTFEEGEIYYATLAGFIAENRYKILPQGVKECITYLVNYSLMWNNCGHDKAGSHALDWYDTLIRYKLLPENGKILPSDYRNIVSLSIINKRDAKWLKDFIDSNETCLPQDYRDTNAAFARAQYYVYIGKYESAMPLFQQALAKDEPVFNMIVKNSQFKCLYESNLQNKEVLLDFLASWERQLHRYTPGLHQLKKVFAKIISYSHKLVLAADKAERSKILAALSKEPFFAGKQWLVSQLKK